MNRLYVNAIGRFSGNVIQRRRQPFLLPSFQSSTRFFSSTEEPTPTKEENTTQETGSKEPESDNSNKNNSAPEKVVIFPWRHEVDPLPRLVEGTVEHETQGQLLSTITTKTGNVQMNALASAFMFLDVPFYQFLFFGSWKGELADSMSWAFTQGVAGLLSNLSSDQVSMNSIVNDTDESLNFHTKVGGKDPVPEAKKEKTEEKVEVPQGVPLENMFEEKLIAFYQSTKENLNQEVEVVLKTIPYSAELVSLYAIPYISRRNVQSDKALLEFYRKMMKKPSMDRTEDLNKLRKDKLEKGIMESTVIAQVQVWCNEVFYVKDVESGKVLQGSDDNDTVRNVPHLVRMESTVKTTKDAGGAFQNVQEDWRITDIDDMLDGNLIV